MNPEIEHLENLLDEILAGIQEMLQSGQPIPQELQELAAEEINALTQEIDTLYTQQPQGGPTPEPTPEHPVNEPVPPGAELLWVLSGSNIDAFVNYLHTIDDPDLNALLHNPDRLDQIIGQLHSQYPKGEPAVANGIEHAPLNSSNIWGARQLKNGKVQVRFQGGSVYEYDGVPGQVFKAFMMGSVPAKTQGRNQYGAWWKGKQPSLGASFHELIKERGYNYRRLR